MYMKINDLILQIKEKLNKNFNIDSLNIEDKTFLHINHKSHIKNKFHIKLTINSKELKSIKIIDANRKIFKVLKEETDNYIHSLQIIIN